MGRHVAPLELWRMYLRVSIYIMLLRSMFKFAFLCDFREKILAPEEVYPAELRGNMLIEIKFRIVRSLQRSEIELKIFRFDIRDNILLEKPD
jgi:hypothetical protein